jgi:hypothetical protein
MVDTVTPGVTPGETDDDNDASLAAENAVEAGNGNDFADFFAEAAGTTPPAEDDEDGKDAQAGQEANAEDRADKAPSEAEAKAPPAEAPGAKPAAGTEPDFLKDLSPEARAHFEAQTRKIDGLTRRVKGLSKITAGAKPRTEAERTAEKEARSALVAEITTAEKDFPDAVGPLAKATKAIFDRLDAHDEALEPIATAASEADLADAFEDLKAEHPDFEVLWLRPNMAISAPGPQLSPRPRCWRTPSRSSFSARWA